jgi:poly(3-hydroxyalkanoate) synthetase
MVVFYKKINKKNEECECCHKQGARYKVVRWVKPGEWSFVAGVNIAPSYYCSKDCMKTVESAEEYVKVKENTINEINSLGYSA